MPEKYGSHERAALVMLMKAGKPVPNPDLTDIGIDLRPAGRDRLIAAGLMKSWKENRRFIHEITDEGVAWCESELTRLEAPPRSGPLVKLIFQLVGVLVAHSVANGTRLVDILSTRDLETLIRIAYLDLSVKPQDWVRLARLRPKLDADKAEVDEVLLRLVKAGEAHLAPDSNRKVLTPADHAAAIRVGSEEKHLMAIEES
jgi:hypothetical protein